MKASSLANFVIVCVAISAILSAFSHMGLTWTTKVIPSEMYTLWSSLAVGAVTAGLLARNLDQNLLIPKTYLNYVLMGLATTQAVFTVNYHLLIWNNRAVEKELVPAIIGLSTVVLTLTNFRNSRIQKPNLKSEDAEIVSSTFMDSEPQRLSQAPENTEPRNR